MSICLRRREFIAGLGGAGSYGAASEAGPEDRTARRGGSARAWREVWSGSRPCAMITASTENGCRDWSASSHGPNGRLDACEITD
jgi:hypothetical protein